MNKLPNMGISQSIVMDNRTVFRGAFLWMLYSTLVVLMVAECTLLSNYGFHNVINCNYLVYRSGLTLSWSS